MPEHDGLMRIFWPADIATSDCAGVVVGWTNSPLDVFVVAILDEVDPRQVEAAFRQKSIFRTAPHSVSRIYESCGHNQLHVLGVSNASEPAPVDPSWVRILYAPGMRLPQIRCARATSIQIVVFERPLPGKMQYFSLSPISLALPGKEAGSTGSASDGEGEGEEEKQDKLKKEKKLQLVEKLKQHSVIKRMPSAKEKALPLIINQINWAWELESLVQKNVSRIGSRPKRSLSVSERVVESATNVWNLILVWLWNITVLYLWPVVQQAFIIGLISHRIAAEALLTVLEWRFKPFKLAGRPPSSAAPRRPLPALKDVSATAQQVEIRLQQFCYWPMQYVTLRRRKNDWESVTKSHPDYIRFYNSLWLVANDVIIGIALGSWIIDNSAWAGEQISILLNVYTVEALQRSISWLMGWPAGLKLNSELAVFLGDLFLWVIDYWAGEHLPYPANLKTWKY
jgi:phosphatidylinositol N-acetylglucosaminyltransferase subunit Q